MSFYGLIAIFADMNPRYLLSLLTVLMALVAMASGNFDWTLRLEYLRIRATDPKAPVSERMACYDSLIRSAGDKVPAEYTIGKARLYESIGDFVSSQREFDALYSRLPADSMSYRCLALHHMASAQYYNGHPGDAIRNALTLIEMDKPDSLLYYNMETSLLLAHIFSSSGLNELADRYIAAAHKAFERMEHVGIEESLLSNFHARLLYSESCTLTDRDDFEGAFALLKEAHTLATDSLDRLDIVKQMACIYGCRNQTETALELYSQSIGQKNFNINEAIAVTSIIKLLLSSGRVDEAQKVASRYAVMLDALNGGFVGLDIKYLRARIALSAGDTSAAFRYLYDAFCLSDSAYRALESEYVKEVINVEEARRGISDRDNTLKHNAMKNALLIVLGLSVFVAAVVIVVGRKRRKRLLAEKTRLEEMCRQHDDETSDSEARYNQEMTAMALRMARIDETLVAVKKESSNLMSNPRESLRTIREAVRSLESQIDVWEVFRTYFEGVNQRFFDKLYQIHPQLTNSEVRMCAFILLNLTTKEIAQMSNRLVRTVETIKYNLRKKLAITESTEAYMRHISVADDVEVARLRDAAIAAAIADKDKDEKK